MKMTIFEMKKTLKRICGRLYIAEEMIRDHKYIAIEIIQMQHVEKKT